jgi:glycosyltransferase involved in cell wall biosynthesis
VLRAADELSNESKISIVLLGDGKDKPKLMEEAANLKLANVHFLPPMPKAQMAEALASSDACLAILKPLKLYATVYPNKIFDYMAAGRPVLLMIDGVIRGVVEEANAGIFVEPGKPSALAAAIRKMMGNPAEGKRMGLAGRKFLEAHFDRSQLAKAMQEILLDTARL